MLIEKSRENSVLSIVISISILSGKTRENSCSGMSEVYIRSVQLGSVMFVLVLSDGFRDADHGGEIREFHTSSVLLNP